MPCGLYGKLPAKRDFIALATPRPFLQAWEPWIQRGLAASRLALGEGWTVAYLRAPIWRFWLGADIAGAGVLGAVMPSADGVGRYFPLTLTGHPATGAAVPPEHEPFDGWFEITETFLLSTLQEDSYETVTTGLAALPDPVPSSLPCGTAGVRHLRGGVCLARINAQGVAASLQRLRPHVAVKLHAGMSYWWTAGGEGFPALAAACRGLPEAAFYTGLLTGRFDEHHA